jgi:hypothetical protein
MLRPGPNLRRKVYRHEREALATPSKMTDVGVHNPQAPGAKSYAEAILATPPASPHQPNGIEKDMEPSKQWANGDVTTPGEYEGAGLYDAPKSPMRFGHRKTSSRGSLRSNASSKKKSENDLFEKYDDGEGAKLTSVKASQDYEHNLACSEKGGKPNGVQTKGEMELVSGRQAAAGWDRSGYADCTVLTINLVR